MRLFFYELSRPKATAKHLAGLSDDLKLSTAQEATARACGYRNWHELASSNPATGLPLPSSTEQDVSVVAALADALELGDNAVLDVVAKTKLIDGKAWTHERHQDCRNSLRRQRGRLTATQIARGKAEAPHRLQPLHEHDDCVRMAYEWLDAQVKTKGVTSRTFALKHIIETWAGRYISTSDVVVAAQMHPNVHGTYPHFNISSRLTQPSDARLAGIGEAFKHYYRERLDPTVYRRRED